MDLEGIERALRERLDALGPAPRAELLHVLTLPDYDRAGRIGEFYGNPNNRTFAELLIDAEEDPVLRAVLVETLREAESGRRHLQYEPSEAHHRVSPICCPRHTQSPREEDEDPAEDEGPLSASSEAECGRVG